MSCSTRNTPNSNFIIGKTHKFLFHNPDKCIYKINDDVEFMNKNGIWINAKIIGFNVKSNRFQAILKCCNRYCKTHAVCVNSIFLRKKGN